MKTAPVLKEALRLFFPLAAAHGALWPVLWVIVDAYDLPLATSIPSSQWHAHEMLFGTYGMALAGFLASAVPEWTDTNPTRSRALVMFALLWLPGRIVGVVGWDALSLFAGLTDMVFYCALLVVIIRPMIARRTTNHLSFVFWLSAFVFAEAGIRIAWFLGEYELSARFIDAALSIFVVFFSLSAARISVVVINLALDPTGASSPYRPHPGRRHAASAMVSAYIVLSLLLPHSLVPGWIALAAGAAFFDRLAEWFIGRAVLKPEVLTLAVANMFGGLGFLALGAARLGADVPVLAGLHLLGVGTLGLAVIAVFIVAGLRHTGRDLVALPWQAYVSIGLVAASAVLRVLPEFGFVPEFYGAHHAASAILWSAAFAIWLQGFVPFLVRPGLADGACR
ncbi:hypothetical protein LPJGGPFB_04757 [Ensifer adhaerens]|uniref:NnrS family protein n=1 Tax=Ensifer adhaerens TaxID=106592 RepID=UPI0015694ACF|nr:NnrS family protein [Ensifer adhaerens]NRP21498.1 hypothetical protein [Ensifer adhaerens]